MFTQRSHMSKPYDFNNPDDALAFTIDMALSRQNVPHRLSKHETRESLETRRAIIATAIVNAIKLSNWKFEKGPTPPGHST